MNLLNKLTNPIKKPIVVHQAIEDDENDIDMSAILNPKLSSTRIERPRHVPPTNEESKRPHSDIIEKVLAGIPLSDSDIRKVIQRKK